MANLAGRATWLLSVALVVFGAIAGWFARGATPTSAEIAPTAEMIRAERMHDQRVSSLMKTYRHQHPDRHDDPQAEIDTERLVTQITEQELAEEFGVSPSEMLRWVEIVHLTQSGGPTNEQSVRRMIDVVERQRQDTRRRLPAGELEQRNKSAEPAM